MIHYLVNLDYKTFVALNDLAVNFPWADKFFYFCAVYLVWVMGFAIAIYLYLTWRKKNPLDPFWVALGSFVLARGIIAQAIYVIHDRNRPFFSHQVHSLLIFANKPSFPSGHATSTFAIAAAFYFYDKKFGAFLYVIALFTILGRVVVGVHYPSDVIAGAIIGVASAYFCNWLYKKYFLQKSKPLLE